MKSEYQIYIITNAENDKVYVGSSKNWFARWSCHKSYAKPNHGKSELYQAMSSIGIDKFNSTVIDMADTERESLTKETEYINNFDSIKNGYNSNYPTIPPEETDTNINLDGVRGIGFVLCVTGAITAGLGFALATI